MASLGVSVPLGRPTARRTSRGSADGRHHPDLSVLRSNPPVPRSPSARMRPRTTASVQRGTHRHDEVVQERSVLLPDLVLLRDQVLLHLRPEGLLLRRGLRHGLRLWIYSASGVRLCGVTNKLLLTLHRTRTVQLCGSVSLLFWGNLLEGR